MSTYEKPVAEIVDFAAEQIMDDTSLDGYFSRTDEGNEPRGL